jgi:hypothetical protein
LILLAPVPVCPLPYICSAAVGFWLAWNDARTVVVNAITAALKANPKYKIVVSGHSFGAAVATLATADLRYNKKWVIDMVSMVPTSYAMA